MAIKKKPVEKKKSTPAKKTATATAASHAKPAKKGVKTTASKKKPLPAAKTKVAQNAKKAPSTAKKAIVKKTTTVKKTTATKKTAAPVKKEETPKAKSASVKKAAVAPKSEPAKTKKPAATVKKETKTASSSTNHKIASHTEEPKVKKTVTKKAPVTNPRFIYRPEPSILDAPQENNGPRRRYSDNDLQEFKDLIQRKLEAARKELVYLQGLITRKDEAGTDDTENKYMGVEDGSGTMEREQLSQLASRQIQYIDHLEKALVRIENKTYGICRVTGKLIDKARLRAVPHATLSIEAKLANKK